MQLLLLLLLLSSGGGVKDFLPLLNDIAGENFKDALAEAENISKVFDLAEAFMPQPPEKTNADGQNGGVKSALFEVSFFADPEIIAALEGCLGG